MDGERGALVVAGTFATSMDAQFAYSMLDSAGIEALITNDVPRRHGYIEVRVFEQDLADALAILREIASAE